MYIKKRSTHGSEIINKYFPRAFIPGATIRSSCSTPNPSLHPPPYPLHRRHPHPPTKQSTHAPTYSLTPSPSPSRCRLPVTSMCHHHPVHHTSARPSTRMYVLTHSTSIRCSAPSQARRPLSRPREKPATLSVLNIFPATLPRIYDSKFMAEA